MSIQGVLLDGPLELNPSRVNASGMEQRNAQAISRRRMIGIDRDNLLQNQNRGGSLLSVIQNGYAQVDLRVEPVGMSVNKCLEDLHRLLVLVLLHQPRTTVVLGNQLERHSKWTVGSSPFRVAGRLVVRTTHPDGQQQQRQQAQQHPPQHPTAWPGIVGHRFSPVPGPESGPVPDRRRPCSIRSRIESPVRGCWVARGM